MATNRGVFVVALLCTGAACFECGGTLARFAEPVIEEFNRVVGCSGTGQLFSAGTATDGATEVCLDYK